MTLAIENVSARAAALADLRQDVGLDEEGSKIDITR
jgi:hypothetical protein